MRPREIERILIKNGWKHKKTKGSHKHFIHDERPGKITVPQHKTDLDIGTAKSILTQAGIDVKEYNL